MRLQSFFHFSVLIFCTFIFTACEDPDEIDLSSEREIISFSISDGSSKIDLQINNSNSTISGDVPFGFNLEEVTTEITLSEGATISPDSGSGQNIANQESYIVTAENGETKTYSLDVTISPNTQNFIVSFSVEIEDIMYDATIIDSENHVKDTLPYFVDLSTLSPVITVSENATISPETGVEQDFRNPLSYQVTAEDGTSRSYTVELITAKSPEKDILSFDLNINDSIFNASIDTESKMVRDTLPYFTDLSSLAPQITISEDASIIPEPEVEQDFTNPVIYEVTAEDGTTQEYTVELAREKSPEKEILSFELYVNDELYVATIDAESKIVRDTLPYYADIVAMSPEIIISENASINPETGIEQDFTNPVTYQLTAENGTTQEYTVDIYREKSPENYLLEFGLDNVEVSKIDGIIDESSTQVNLRVPSTVDLTNVVPFFQVSDRATVSSDLSNGIDLSSPYSFEVVAENGSSKIYVIETEVMDINEGFSFEDGTASKWFGGDNRSSIGPRNLGTGQSISITENLHLQSFSVHFNEEFDYFENPDFTGHEVEIILEIRSNDGSLLASNSVVNPASFDGGWVTFDFRDRAVHLTNDTEYIFAWYLPNGFSNGYNSGSSGDVDMGYPEGRGFDVRIDSEEEDIADWSNWFENEWDFWFRMESLK